MCLLFETIRIIDREPRNLSLHEERMNLSRSVLFGSTKPVKLADHISVPDNEGNQILRCRVIYSDSVISVEFSGYTPANVRTLKLVEADTLDYSHKYVDRSHLTALVDKNAADDILIVRNGLITDTSYSNIVFSDGRKWVTPDSPLLKGTMRESLLRTGVITAARIAVGDLRQFTHFRLINAMLGFNAPELHIGNII